MFDVSRYASDLHAPLNESIERWRKFTMALAMGDRVLAWGDPGTGKSRAACTVGLDGRNVSRSYLTPETPAAEPRGHYLPNAQGGFTWHDGVAIKAWKYGERLVIEELDQISGDCVPFYHAILDDKEQAFVTLPTGEIVRPNPRFSCVATQNSKPENLPEALKDRFTMVHHLNTPNPTILDTFSPALRHAAAHAIYSPPSRKRDQVNGTRFWVELNRLVSKVGVSLAAALDAMGLDASHDCIRAINVSALTSER